MSFMNLHFRYPHRDPDAERVSFGCPPYSPWEPPKTLYEKRHVDIYAAQTDPSYSISEAADMLSVDPEAIEVLVHQAHLKWCNFRRVSIKLVEALEDKQDVLEAAQAEAERLFRERNI